MNSLRVAIIGTTGNSGYSGGRMYALMIGYQLALTGNNVHFIANNKPQFFEDFDIDCTENITFHLSSNFRDDLPSGDFDYVIVVPTGNYAPQFYEKALNFAHKANARVCLLNFETADWYNNYVPKPKDPNIWDYWRRTVLHGGLVISGTNEGKSWAQKFYFSMDNAPLAFDVCPVAINSFVADGTHPFQKDGSLIAFVRTQDPHKGDHMFMDLDPAVYAGRCLRLISGQGFDPVFIDQIKEKLSHSPGASLELYEKISDAEKYELLAKSSVLIFPSNFEGFGLPPVEAAYMGTQVVCFDIPVLRENVGEIAHFAPLNDTKILSDQILAAIENPKPASLLKKSVYNLANFHRVAAQFDHMLKSNYSKLKPYFPFDVRVEWGPWKPISKNIYELNQKKSTSILPVLKSVSFISPNEVLLHLCIFGDIDISNISDQATGLYLPYRQKMKNAGPLPEILVDIEYNQCCEGDLIELFLHNSEEEIIPISFKITHIEDTTNVSPFGTYLTT